MNTPAIQQFEKLQEKILSKSFQVCLKASWYDREADNFFSAIIDGNNVLLTKPKELTWIGHYPLQQAMDGNWGKIVGNKLEGGYVYRETSCLNVVNGEEKKWWSYPLGRF